MKNTKQIASILFVCGMISAVSCGSSGIDTSVTTDTGTNESEETTPASRLSELPKTDFNGYEFRIMGQNTTERQNFYFEELDGEVVNDAIYARDLEVADYLNIKLTYSGYTDRAEAAKILTAAVLADEEAYDLAMNSISDGVNKWISAGILKNLFDIPYLSLDSNEYWNRSMYDNMSMNGALYCTTGAITPVFYKTPIVLVMNMKLAEDFKVGDLYQTVLDGKWTVDKLHALTKDISRDLDNDGKMTKNDFYGLTVEGTFGGALFNSSGYKVIDENCKLMLSSNTAVDIVQNLASKFGSRDTVFVDPNAEGPYREIFRAGNSLFVNSFLLGVITLRDVEFDFAILPSPKYDESQDVYYTTCNTWLPSGVVVPKNCSDPERTGLIMETMAYFSKKHIVPAIYDITLHGKTTRDENSSKMLDIIFENAYYDMVTALNVAGSAELLRYCVLGERDNFVSAYASIEAIAQAEIDKIIAAE